MSCSDYEYETDSGCVAVKVHVRDDPDETSSRFTNFLPYIGISDLTKNKTNLARAVLAEFVGTLLLVLMGCGSCMGGDRHEAGIQLDDQANIVRISLCFGITVASLAQAIGHISGCHINPAVTLALFIGRKIGFIRAVVYILAQCSGAWHGASILQAVVPTVIRGSSGLGSTSPNPVVSAGQAVGIELLITLLLVLVVFASAADEKNAPNVKGSAPLAIGLTVTACHLFAVPLTGSSMNPARSLGPALVLGNFTSHWIYWVGPLVGGVLGAILYQLVFRVCEIKKKKGVNKMQVLREDESPPYFKKDDTLIKPAYNVLATKEEEGKELVWIENLKQ